MINVGVIGAGAWGSNLIRNVALCPQTNLAAVCDVEESARRAVAGRYRETVTVPDIESLLNVSGLDAVIVATPPQLHFAHARQVLEAGLDALVEKPLCPSSRQAAELVALAESQRCVLMVGHTFLYNNLVGEVKRRIDSGELGEVRYLYSQRLNLGQVRRDVDALWNLAPHDISIANYLLGGRPEAVNARGATFIQRRQQLADVAFFQMDYADGRLVSGHVSWLDPQKVRRTVVVGSERMLVYDDMDTSAHIQMYDKAVEVDFHSPMADFADFATRLRAGDLVIPNVRLKEPLGVEIEHFARCVQDRTRPLTDGRSGLELVCILEAMSQSMERSGAQVEVEYAAAGAGAR